MRLTTQQAYVVLGVSRDADSDQVRQAYRKLALQFHPDKNPDPSATEQFQQLSAAYKRICDHQSRSSGNNAADSDEDAGFGDDGDVDLDDMDISFEEMLMMFQMLFGQATHGGSSKHKAKTKTKKKTHGKAPQVRLPRRGGRAGSKGGRRGFTQSSLFGSAEEMMFQSFMTMEMAREMNELESDFKAMSSFFGSNFGDSDYSFPSDDENDDGEDVNVSADSMQGSKATLARHESHRAQDESSKIAREPSSAGEDRRSSSEIDDEPKASVDSIELDVQVRVFGKLTGVVKFKGPVHYAKGDFLGVQLSEPVGKNDGTIKGVAYFACPAQHGLMVRPEDVVLVA